MGFTIKQKRFAADFYSSYRLPLYVFYLVSALGSFSCFIFTINEFCTVYVFIKHGFFFLRIESVRFAHSEEWDRQNVEIEISKFEWAWLRVVTIKLKIVRCQLMGPNNCGILDVQSWICKKFPIFFNKLRLSFHLAFDRGLITYISLPQSEKKASRWSAYRIESSTLFLANLKVW